MTSITVVQLYPADMNIYGDHGNVLALTRRLRRYGYEVDLVTHNQGDALRTDADIVIGGGGQDSGQGRVTADLLANADALRGMAADGTPMLMICGLYQLFGHYFQTRSGERLEGIGVLDAATVGKDQRLIGNIVLESPEFGTIVGYENHSGQTFLGSDATPLGTVTSGDGNNAEDSSEGARQHNVIGSYLHGSLLPKNPAVTDFLISTAVERKGGSFTTEPLVDLFVDQARSSAQSRPR